MTLEINQINRAQFNYLRDVQTRWADNDIFGHVNNVVYYSYFDTVANNFLIEEGGFNPQQDDVIGYVVHSQCSYLKGFSHPATLTAGFLVEKLGNSSVTYGIALFVNDETKPSAYGTFTHVFVNRLSERPVAIPDNLRIALQAHLNSN